MKNWRHGTRSDKQAVEAFLRRFEPDTTAIIDRTFLSTDSEPDNWWQDLWLYGQDEVLGVLYTNRFGLCMPFFPSLDRCREASRDTSNGPYQPFALVGRDSDTLNLINRWAPPQLHWHYLSFSILFEDIKNWASEHTSKLRGINCRLARPEDLDKLLPLECDYQREEVLTPGMVLYIDGARVSLEKAIKQQRIFLAEVGTEIVAKASVNASGWKYKQIGGVFTKKMWRNHGVASSLMNFLVQSILEEGRGLTLFVKRENLPALRVYGKLGFKPRCSYSIIYY